MVINKISCFTLTLGTQSAVYERGTNTFFVERSCVSSLPYCIDDPHNSTTKGGSISDLAVDLYSGNVTAASMRSASLVPKCTPLIATNFRLRQDER